MRILITSPDEDEYSDIVLAVKQLITETKNIPLSWDDEGMRIGYTFLEIFEPIVNTIDLLIADLSEKNGDVTLEIGYALGNKIPVIGICSKEYLTEVEIDRITGINIVYDRQRIQETLIKPLHKVITTGAFKDNNLKQKQVKETKTVFLSYSHTDLGFLERLMVHMKPFERNGQIDLWADTKIKAGEKWKDKIIHALDKAAIALLLISADFLASDFIVDNELPPLLKGAEDKGKVIIPIIVKPCRFSKHNSLSTFQSINDPKLPLSKMDESAREDIYVKICDYIDNLVH